MVRPEHGFAARLVPGAVFADVKCAYPTAEVAATGQRPWRLWRQALAAPHFFR